jgi:hypothetical protein
MVDEPMEKQQITIQQTNPDAPCMEYLPTFTPKMTQFCR